MPSPFEEKTTAACLGRFLFHFFFNAAAIPEKRAGFDRSGPYGFDDGQAHGTSAT
jgi:hypothetical protein